MPGAGLPSTRVAWQCHRALIAVGAMMIRHLAVTAAALAALLAPAPGRADILTWSGDWQIHADADPPAGMGRLYAGAVRGDFTLALRCVDHHITLFFLPKPYLPTRFVVGQSYAFQIGIDLQPVVELNGIATSDQAIKLQRSDQLIGYIAEGFRAQIIMRSAAGSVQQFLPINGATAAVMQIEQDCGRPPD